MSDSTELDRIIFALLFASDEPLSAERISNVLEESSSSVNESLQRLASQLAEDRSSTMLEQVALGYQLATRPEFSKYIARLYSGKRKQRLSRAGLETLAIIAYKQPITRADIENIRGVGCGGVITTLMERTLIRIVGKAKILGGPFLYGTTHEFLEYLGLNDLSDLPGLEELEALLEKEEYGEAWGGQLTKFTDVFPKPSRDVIDPQESSISGEDDLHREGSQYDLEPQEQTQEADDGSSEEPPSEEKTYTE
ncbi:MAG: SMC-Scp complex subunit ScpB [Candidatus Latescibacterota bacterium]